ncbi:MAG: ATP-grasp domain-containing protein [Candidatus Thorarchaeota archaeon]
MKIGILSKRKTMFTHELKANLENRGFTVTIYTLENLIINENLLNNDFYILKSKNLFFLYAGYYLEANNILVIPKPHISFVQKNRIQSNFLMKKIGILTPDIYLATADTFRNELREYPYILKPIMGSGSKGVKIIRSIEDLELGNDKIVYLEKYIKGLHYNVYFIGDSICTLIKPPLSNEHVDMKKIDTPDDIKNLINKWIAYFNGEVLFGHLDIVREEFSNKLYTVDTGSFPEFVHYTTKEGKATAVKEISNIILGQFKKEKNKKGNQQKAGKTGIT